MSGIYHSWDGTVLTITSDSGTSSADLKGDDGCRGPQGPGGGQYFPEKGKDYMTEEEVQEIAGLAAGLVEPSLDEIRTDIDSLYGDLESIEGSMATTSYADSVANSAKRNENILINWYFAKPVNQRGQTTYTAEAFCIDRWYFEQWSNTNPQLVLNDGFITLSCTDAKGDTNTNCIKQTIENPGLYSGKTVTFSVKFKNVAVDGDAVIMIRSVGDSGTKVANKTITASFANSIQSVTTTLQEGLTSLMVVIGNYANNSGDGNHTLEIESAKLELGNVSTLAYDAPPNYQLELLKCQRYFIRYYNSGSSQFLVGATTGTTVYATLCLPTAMCDSVSATISYNNVNIYPFISGGSEAVTGVGGYLTTSRNSCIITASHATSSNLPAKSPATIRLAEGGYIDISCEI